MNAESEGWQRTYVLNDDEVFDLDVWLAGVIKDAVARLIKQNDDFRSYPVVLDSYEQWREILNEIYEGMKLIQEDCWGTYEEYESQRAVRMRARQLLAEHFESLWI